MTTELQPDDLYRHCDPRMLPFDTTAEDPSSVAIIGQDRAIDAARFAIGMRHDGYNVFALGPEGIGKASVIRQLLEREAAVQPTPSDWVLVLDFAEPHRPRALELQPGTATRFRDEVRRAITELQSALPAAFASEEYRTRKHQLVHAFEQRQHFAFDELAERARRRRVAVIRADDGIALAGLCGDQMIESEEFTKLPEEERTVLDDAMQQVGIEISTMFRDFHAWASEHSRSLAALDREIAEATTRTVIDGVRSRHRELPVLEHLAAVARDIADNVDQFVRTGDDAVPEVIRRALHRRDEGTGRLQRYEVNVMVDHGSRSGAPIVTEEHPTHANLIGRIEHTSELGALVTNFTLVRAGALHRANGGYLLLDAVKLLQQPFAWDSLKRALRTREIRIEAPGQALGLVSTVSLEPAPIPLQAKVILFGDRPVYDLLAAADPEFDELFKVMADFEPSVDRSRDSITAYASAIAALVRQELLRPFDRRAVARVIEHGSRLAGDAQKLSLHLRSIIDLLREASDHARRSEREIVTVDDVEGALAGQRHRAGRLHDAMLEAIRRKTHLIETRGDVVGQINGLSVVELGRQAFGYPTRITSRARLGQGEVVDIEREVELGGPIHSKGVLILASLLGARYAKRVPLSLSASLVFEQSYGGVEGDSASLAELCVLLSAIGELAIRQGLALTGSVDQHGSIQPIGAVNEKIEAFFDACCQHGLTGEQGVVIPHANVQHLMLRKDVVDSVAENRFHLHAVQHIDDAISLVMGLPVARVDAAVEAHLTGFAEDARRFVTGTAHEKWRHAG